MPKSTPGTAKASGSTRNVSVTALNASSTCYLALIGQQTSSTENQANRQGFSRRPGMVDQFRILQLRFSRQNSNHSLAWGQIQGADGSCPSQRGRIQANRIEIPSKRAHSTKPIWRGRCTRARFSLGPAGIRCFGAVNWPVNLLHPQQQAAWFCQQAAAQ